MGDVARYAQQTDDLAVLVAVLAFDGLEHAALAVDKRERVRYHGLVAAKNLGIVGGKAILAPQDFAVGFANQAAIFGLPHRMCGGVGKQITALQVFDKHNI